MSKIFFVFLYIIYLNSICLGTMCLSGRVIEGAEFSPSNSCVLFPRRPTREVVAIKKEPSKHDQLPNSPLRKRFRSPSPKRTDEDGEECAAAASACADICADIKDRPDDTGDALAELASAQQAVLCTPATPVGRTACLAVVGPSPWCGADMASGGCKDPRFLRRSLDYTFPDLKGVVKCDDWHDHHLLIISNIIKRNHIFFRYRNADLIGFNVIYSHEGTLHISADENLNFLYISGGKKISDTEVDLKIPPLKERIIIPRTVDNVLSTGEEGEAVTVKLRHQLRKIYSNIIKTKLSPTTIASRRRELHSPPPYKSLRVGSRPNSAFHIACFHSETAALMDIMASPEMLDPLLMTLPSGAIVHQIIFKHASVKQMCRKCGAAWFISSEDAGPLKTALESHVTKLGLKIKEDGLSLFTQVSAIFPFDPLDASGRTVQLLKVNETIDSLRCSPHIAQRCTPCQLKIKPSKITPPLPGAANATPGRVLFTDHDD
jgi:hypothetical protein